MPSISPPIGFGVLLVTAVLLVPGLLAADTTTFPLELTPEVSFDAFDAGFGFDMPTGPCDFTDVGPPGLLPCGSRVPGAGFGVALGFAGGARATGFGVADFADSAFEGPVEDGKAFFGAAGGDGFTAVFFCVFDAGPSADIDLLILSPYPLM